jgi:hypothetical protein
MKIIGAQSLIWLTARSPQHRRRERKKRQGTWIGCLVLLHVRSLDRN